MFIGLRCVIDQISLRVGHRVRGCCIEARVAECCVSLLIIIISTTTPYEWTGGTQKTEVKVKKNKNGTGPFW